MHDLKEVLLKFLNGSITQNEYKFLKGFLLKELRKLSERYGIEPEEDIVHDFLVHVAEKAYYFKELIEEKRFSVSYLKTSFRNFLIDYVKRKEIPQSLDSLLEDEDKKPIAEKILSQPSKVIHFIELKEFIETFDRTFDEEEVKVLCYLYDKSYKCLWKEKTETAIYKHVSRNRKKILEKLKNLARQLEASDKVLEEFIRNTLSEKCEKLRLTYCKEEQ